MQALNGKKQDGKSQIYAQTRLLKDIKGLLCDMTTEPQEESLAPILFCDDDCNVTGATAFIRDEETTAVITQYFDANLAPSTTPPTGSPCGPKCALDYEIVENCYENINTCEKYKQLLTFTFKAGVKELVSVCWLLPDGTISTDTPTDVRPCTDDCNCNPLDESFTGNNATLTSFNEFSLFIPKCCEITVTTSAGSFVIPAQEQPFMFSKCYQCFVSNFQIAGSCVDDVHTILSKTK